MKYEKISKLNPVFFLKLKITRFIFFKFLKKKQSFYITTKLAWNILSFYTLKTGLSYCQVLEFLKSVLGKSLAIMLESVLSDLKKYWVILNHVIEYDISELT